MKLNLVLAFCLFDIISCKKNNPSTILSSTPVDIYISGSYNGHAAYWKNGTLNLLDKDTASSNYSEAAGICVSGGDVYVCGSVDYSSVPVFWKNGVIDTLQNDPYSLSNPIYTNAFSIRVSGNIVYIGGRQFVAGYAPGVHLNNGAVLWTNGVPTYYGDSTAYINSLFLSNGTLYSSGSTGQNDIYYASYFKDGSVVNLPNKSGTISETNSVYVSGNNVYSTGPYTGTNGFGNAVYWKNGNDNILSTNVSFANSIFVAGNDIYVGGSETINGVDVATIWKNGVATHLSSLDSQCYQVWASGNDVYAIGATYDMSSLSTPIFWKNGVATILGAQGSYAEDMFIIPR